MNIRPWCARGHELDPKWRRCPHCEDSGPVGAVGALVRLDGPNSGRTFWLVEGKNHVGAAADNTIALRDEEFLCARHFMINAVFDEKERVWVFIVSDQDSAGGTFLNDSEEPLSREELIDNDVVRWTSRPGFRFRELDRDPHHAR